MILFHNHPLTLVDSLVDPMPIASVADRLIMLSFLAEPAIALKSVAQGKQLQWYVGQNGYVREFTTPDFIHALELAASFSKNL